MGAGTGARDRAVLALCVPPPPPHLDGLALGGSIVGHAARVLLHRAVRVRVRVSVIGLGEGWGVAYG